MNRAVFLLVTLLASVMFSGVTLAADDPTIHQVYEATNAGKLGDAQAMMAKVLKDHPNSGKAHFIEAELLAKQGQLSKAKDELITAERLAPGLPFAKPASVEQLKQRLSGNHAAVQPISETYAAHPQGHGSSGISWPMLLMGMGLIVAVIMFIRSLRQRNNVYPSGGGAMYGQGYGSAAPMQPYGGGGMGQPMGPAAGGMGSGILGGLATGAAMGAGMVAGEALIHHFTDGNRQDISQMPLQSGTDNWGSTPDDMGGNDFGISDGSSWDDGSSGGGDW